MNSDPFDDFLNTSYIPKTCYYGTVGEKSVAIDSVIVESNRESETYVSSQNFKIKNQCITFVTQDGKKLVTNYKGKMSFIEGITYHIKADIFSHKNDVTRLKRVRKNRDHIKTEMLQRKNVKAK